MTPPLPQPVAGGATRADAGRSSVANFGPFVINLCSSTTPMALEQTKLGELKQRFTFFVSRRREDGRERFRLHMGYFETENEAEEWLAVVRDIYPGAWTGETPGKRLREREAAAAPNAAPPNLSAPRPPAQMMAGIAKIQETNTRLRTPTAAMLLDQRRNEIAPTPLANAKPANAQPAPFANVQTAPIATGQSEFSVTFEAAPPASTPAYSPPQPDLAPTMLAAPLPASAPDAARSALVAASASAQAAVRMTSPPPVLVVPTLQEAPPQLPPFASIPVLSAPTVSAPAPTVVPAAAAANATISATTADTMAQIAPITNVVAPKFAPPVFNAPSAPTPFAKPAPFASATPDARAPQLPARSTAPIAKPVPLVAKQAPSIPVRQAAKAAPHSNVKATKSAPGRAPIARPNTLSPASEKTPQAGTSSTNSLSNVAEVLASLDETGQTRQMPALPMQQLTAPTPLPPMAPTSAAMSDTQVLKYLETRRADGSEQTNAEADDGISLLRPDDTGTVRALKEAVTTNQPVAFAVQLKWSVQPIELSQVPPLAIFSAYTLYTVEGSREGRKWFGLRLGFFTDAISAKQVAYYVRSEFASVAVVPVSPQERSRASDASTGGNARAGSPPRKPPTPPVDEFKLIDTVDTPVLPVRAPPPRPAAVTASAPKAQMKPQPKAPTPPPMKQKAKTPGKVRAKERRSPQSLEETLEILGADQLEIDNGRGERLNDTGVRHLKVSMQKNSPFSRLLDRLSDRVGK